MDKEEKHMSPHAITKITEKKKMLTEDRKNQMLKAGGSIKTRNTIDAHEICREVRGKQ